MASPFAPVVTEHMRLLMPPPAEASVVLGYFERNREHLERWEPSRPQGFYTEPFWRRRLELNLRELEVGHSLRLFLSLHEGDPLRQGDSARRFIGTINFTNVIRGAFLACHLGYAIDGDVQGRGLMREALEAALPLAFERLGLHRIMANYQPSNERSGRLLRSLGFRVEGYAYDYLFIDGAWRDHVLTALVHASP